MKQKPLELDDDGELLSDVEIDSQTSPQPAIPPMRPLRALKLVLLVSLPFVALSLLIYLVSSIPQLPGIIFIIGYGLLIPVMFYWKVLRQPD